MARTLKCMSVRHFDSLHCIFRTENLFFVDHLHSKIQIQNQYTFEWKNDEHLMLSIHATKFPKECIRSELKFIY